MPKSEKQYRWKGRIVSPKVYAQRVKQTELVLQLKEQCKKLDEYEASVSSKEPVNDKNNGKKAEILEGCRIVNLKYLGKQLWCISCKEALSLEYVESERRIGLASILMVKCHKCLIINEIYTGKQKSSIDKRSLRYDINYKSVIGALHSGLGWTHLQKLFACMDIPSFGFRAFKQYGKEIGLPAEDVAKESCRKVDKLEKEKTIEQSQAQL